MKTRAKCETCGKSPLFMFRLLDGTYRCERCYWREGKDPVDA